MITWGPSNKLVCENPEVKVMLKQIMEAGVKVYACKRCADSYGITEQLEKMGIEVKLMGEVLTQFLKDQEYRILSV